MIEKNIYYNIADLQLEVTLAQDCNIETLLPNFEPFRVEYLDDVIISCRIVMSSVDLEFNSDESKLLSDISIVWGDRFTFHEDDDYYWTLIQYSQDKTKHWKMRSSKDFKLNTVFSGDFESTKNSFISWFFMVAFAQSALLNRCILIHSSVVVDEDYGYAFLGKSGTGKSTHSRLWLQNIPGISLLNDDNPAIRIFEDNIVIYGTPWSGKTKCYINDKRPLKGLVRLKQAPFNLIQPQKSKDALLALLPSCSAIRWNNSLYSTLVNLIIDLISKVQVAELQCLPDAEAAQMCYNELRKDL
ncbi:hypothetical protein [Sphingobacterium bovistauri]|uniref:Phosphoenolpyruvate carboxykinase n=1 Tax=Sphingobacterium bovistauri TaxID=2781959 RepID=A0ABS7Z1S8_9SPHI|nr:hypothetical protein [Sphingobacterium bovistauri]MCA5004131.1 hypothetical protein [Sphingobacterium bovistauri]